MEELYLALDTAGPLVTMPNPSMQPTWGDVSRERKGMRTIGYMDSPVPTRPWDQVADAGIGEDAGVLTCIVLRLFFCLVFGHLSRRSNRNASAFIPRHQRSGQGSRSPAAIQYPTLGSVTMCLGSAAPFPSSRRRGSLRPAAASPRQPDQGLKPARKQRCGRRARYVAVQASFYNK